MKPPKEKAKELVKRFWMKNKTGQDSYNIAINNANITVDEIIDVISNMFGDNTGDYNYWTEVKQELEKL